MGNIMQFYHWIPEKIKLCGDAIAGLLAILSLPVVDVFQGLMAGLASFAAFTYTMVRLHYYLKDRRDNNRK